MRKRCYWIWYILLLGFIVLPLQSQNSIFEQRKQQYLEADGGNLYRYYQKVWAWLENLKNGKYNASTHYVLDVDKVSRPVGEVISKLIRCWGTVWTQSGYPPYGYGWCYAEWPTNVELIWILLRYNDVISSSDRIFLQQLYSNYITDRNFSPGTENSQLHDMTGRYLYAQYYPDVKCYYSYNPPPNSNIKSFSYGGRTYIPGNQYSTYELTRDWIYAKMDEWVQQGNGELDSPNYSWTFLHSFIALSELAVDPVMRRKAQMMADFLFLEFILDYSANHWGGALGRVYEKVIVGGQTQYYFDFFWNVARSAVEPSYDVLMSNYRVPEVIRDIGDLSDEPDNYYHINMEYNANIVYCPGTGKWTYVTKFFNLGGRIGPGWLLNIYSQDSPGTYGRPGIPFTLWINTKGTGEGVATPAPGEVYLTYGEYGYQYKNAMFIRGSKLHFANYPNSWDMDQSDPPWRFLKEGRTMVGICINDSLGVSGLEVAIEGVDYASFDSFKYACRRYCRLTPYLFRTTRGDEISLDRLPNQNDWTATVKRAGSSKFEYVWNFPFPRVQAMDHRGQYMVRWEGNRMIVKRHGIQRVYDFTDWTVTESSAGADTVPPDSPKGVSVR